MEQKKTKKRGLDDGHSGEEKVAKRARFSGLSARIVLKKREINAMLNDAKSFTDLNCIHDELFQTRNALREDEKFRTLFESRYMKKILSMPKDFKSKIVYIQSSDWDVTNSSIRKLMESLIPELPGWRWAWNCADLSQPYIGQEACVMERFGAEADDTIQNPPFDCTWEVLKSMHDVSTTPITLPGLNHPFTSRMIFIVRNEPAVTMFPFRDDPTHPEYKEYHRRVTELHILPTNTIEYNNAFHKILCQE